MTTYLYDKSVIASALWDIMTCLPARSRPESRTQPPRLIDYNASAMPFCRPIRTRMRLYPDAKLKHSALPGNCVVLVMYS
jgi:hypothetical protein